MLVQKHMCVCVCVCVIVCVCGGTRKCVWGVVRHEASLGVAGSEVSSLGDIGLLGAAARPG
jgi:hypothetical protein